MSLVDDIKHQRPCPPAVVWLSRQESWPQAWRDCKRGDWMLWLIGKQITSAPWSDDRKPLLACCLDCAETVKHLWPADLDKSVARSIGVLRAWVRGDDTVDNAKVARRELSSVAAAAATPDDYHVATDDYPVYAAAFAADSASVTRAGVASAAADSATTNGRCADIVRFHYPSPPIITR